MDFVNEFKKRVKRIDDSLNYKAPKYTSTEPVVRYDLVIRDCEGKVIKTVAWGISLKECLTLAKHMEKSKLIKQSNGEYSLYYLKAEKGLYNQEELHDNNRV